ncbi:DUF4290 domain-containing protein [Marinilabiliaceae bacterium JC017]|nr:DUF4290 domain-containing protein [Marinilabiliaceae bacterium JC017]
MDYNSNRKKLVLPEYGRHIQKMVDYAKAIEDPEERAKSAKSIIAIMGNMFPHLRDVSDFKHKLWDHLAIMANFEIDIEFPYKLPEPSILYRRPTKLPYNTSKIRYRHYGKVVEELIGKAIEMEEGEEKKKLILLIANHMKKSLYLWNKDSVNDDRIFNDIKMLSNNQLTIDENLKIPDYKESNHRSRKKRPQKRTSDREKS